MFSAAPFLCSDSILRRPAADIDLLLLRQLQANVTEACAGVADATNMRECVKRAAVVSTMQQGAARRARAPSPAAEEEPVRRRKGDWRCDAISCRCCWWRRRKKDRGCCSSSGGCCSHNNDTTAAKYTTTSQQQPSGHAAAARSQGLCRVLAAAGVSIDPVFRPGPGFSPSVASAPPPTTAAQAPMPLPAAWKEAVAELVLDSMDAQRDAGMQAEAIRNFSQTLFDAGAAFSPHGLPRWRCGRLFQPAAGD